MVAWEAIGKQSGVSENVCRGPCALSGSGTCGLVLSGVLLASFAFAIRPFGAGEVGRAGRAALPFLSMIGLYGRKGLQSPSAHYGERSENYVVARRGPTLEWRTRNSSASFE